MIMAPVMKVEFSMLWDIDLPELIPAGWEFDPSREPPYWPDDDAIEEALDDGDAARAVELEAEARRFRYLRQL